MTPKHKRFCRTILMACSIYLMICGLSAIFLPTSWLWAAGLPTDSAPTLNLVFSVLGAYLAALSIGAWLASSDPVDHKGIIIVLLCSQAFDCLCTMWAIYSGSLPVATGSVFIIATVVWFSLLYRCLQNQSA